MKIRLITLISFFILSGLSLPSAAQEKIQVDMTYLTSILSYNFDQGKLLGEFSMSLYGIGGGEVVIAIDNSDGKRVFDQKYPCVQGYSGDTPSCSIDPTSQKDNLKPYAVQSGLHTIHMFYHDSEFFSMKVLFNVKEEYGSKNIYVTGDWAQLALLQLSAQPAIRANIYVGGPDQCGGDGYDAQVLLLRDGEFVARGHMEGLFYQGCSTGQLSVSLFREDDKHFTRWITADDILGKDGAYELVLHKNRTPDRSFPFSVSGGVLTPDPAAAKASPLSPDSLYAYPKDFWLFRK